MLIMPAILLAQAATEPPKVQGEAAQILLWLLILAGLAVLGLAGLLRHYAVLYRQELRENQKAEVSREVALSRASTTLEARDATIATQATTITGLRAELEAQKKEGRHHG